MWGAPDTIPCRRRIWPSRSDGPNRDLTRERRRPHVTRTRRTFHRLLHDRPAAAGDHAARTLPLLQQFRVVREPIPVEPSGPLERPPGSEPPALAQRPIPGRKETMNQWRRLALLVAGLAAFAGTANAQNEFASDAARLVTALKLHDGQTVADIGAGRGQLTVALARVVGPSGRVYATELDSDRLRDIRQATDSAGLGNVSVIEAHAARTNLPERCCDALVLRRVYHHFDNPQVMNASMRQSLKTGGLLAVIDFAPDSAESPDPGNRDSGDQHGVTSATVVRELRQAGFEVVAVEKGTRPGRYMVVVRRPSD